MIFFLKYQIDPTYRSIFCEKPYNETVDKNSTYTQNTEVETHKYGKCHRNLILIFNFLN